MSEVEFKKFAICDTCGIETLCREDGEDDQCGGCYWAPINHAKHEAELAALREELAVARSDISTWRIHYDRKSVALDAADQRNADLVELLRDVSKQAGDHHASHQSWNLKTQLANIHQKIEAALKPTESGASE